MSARPDIRGATPADADEVLRLAHLMWTEFNVRPSHGPWEGEFRSAFVDVTTRDDARVFVVDDPDHPGQLAAMGAAWVQTLLPAFWLVHGKIGMLQWFYTVPRWRSRGIATEMARRAIAWLHLRGCTRVQLHSSSQAERLYRSLGFADSTFTNLWLHLPDGEMSDATTTTASRPVSDGTP